MKRVFSVVIMAATLLLAPGTSLAQGQLTYAALGDSVAAGVGLSGAGGTCGRSAESYPEILAREGGMKLTSLACSGATVWNGLITDQETGSGDVPSQLHQLQAVRPDVVTLTIGANDRLWLQRIQRCYQYDCAAHPLDWTMLGFEAKLYAALLDIKRSGAWSITVTQYYDPFGDSNEACPAAPGITSAEVGQLRDELAELNQGISKVANRVPGVHVAKPDYTGHGICSDDPWIQALGDPAPLHPTAAGEEAIARSVQSVW